MANGFQDYTPDWWQEVLKGFEPAQYYSAPKGVAFGSRSPRRQRYFQDSYQDVLQNYYQQAGSKMRQGKAPASFMDYLETDPWTARYSALPQTARGVTGMAANPRTRFLFNF